jgi:transcriptional antiterminator NusG
MSEAQWYVVHTYSGYENKVKVDIEKTIENRGLQDQILEVSVPLEEVIELKNGTQKQVERKMFPGYVLIHMIMNDDSWYVVRNTRGVTGFVGPDSKPTPLSNDEVLKLGVEKHSVEVSYQVGDLVNIIDGIFDGFSGVVEEIDTENNVVKVTVSALFGKETLVEMELDQVEVAED